MRIKSTTGVDMQVRRSMSDDTPNRKADTKLISSFEVIMKKGMSTPHKTVDGGMWKPGLGAFISFCPLFRDRDSESL